MKDIKDMKRILLKLSGEALAGDKKTGFDEATCMDVARQVKVLADRGLQISIVIGGGNFWRGRTSENMERTKADQIGMLEKPLIKVFGLISGINEDKIRDEIIETCHRLQNEN